MHFLLVFLAACQFVFKHFLFVEDANDQHRYLYSKEQERPPGAKSQRNADGHDKRCHIHRVPNERTDRRGTLMVDGVIDAPADESVVTGVPDASDLDDFGAMSEAQLVESIEDGLELLDGIQMSIIQYGEQRLDRLVNS